MSTYTTTRHIDPEALPFGSVMRADDATRTWTVEADVDPATLKAAVDAAPLDPTSTRDANAADLRSKATLALTANATFLALGSPSNAQTLAQVQRLTRECNALIRLLLSLVDETAGT